MSDTVNFDSHFVRISLSVARNLSSSFSSLEPACEGGNCKYTMRTCMTRQFSVVVSSSITPLIFVNYVQHQQPKKQIEEFYFVDHVPAMLREVRAASGFSVIRRSLPPSIALTQKLGSAVTYSSIHYNHSHFFSQLLLCVVKG